MQEIQFRIPNLSFPDLYFAFFASVAVKGVASASGWLNAECSLLTAIRVTCLTDPHDVREINFRNNAERIVRRALVVQSVTVNFLRGWQL